MVEFDFVLIVARLVQDILHVLNNLLNLKLGHFGEANYFIKRFDGPQEIIGVRSDPVELLVAQAWLVDHGPPAATSKIALVLFGDYLLL